MIDQLKRMAVFATIVEQGSISAAARALDTTPSAVSQLLRQLERDVGATLLHRSTRRLQLTSAGERFHEGCAAMLAAARGAQRQMEQAREAPVGELRVAAPVGFARHLAPALAPLLAAHAGLSLHLQVDDTMIDLAQARIDLAIRFGRLPDSSWVGQRIAELPQLICAAPAYLAARGVPGNPQELLRHDWLRLTLRGVGGDVELQGPGGEAERLSVRVRATSNNQLTLQQLCESGLGLAVLAAQDAQDALRSGALVPVLAAWRPPSLPMMAVTPQRDAQPAKVRHAIEAVRGYMARHPLLGPGDGRRK